MQLSERVGAYLVLDGVDAIVLSIERSDEHVVGDVVNVATILQPGAGHTDVVSRALALGLDQNQRILKIHDTRQVKQMLNLSTKCK